MMLEIQVLIWNRHTNVAVLNRLMYLNSEHYLDENLDMYITKHNSTGNTCSDKLFESDSMRLAITTHLSFYYKTDETFIICHEDFIIQLSPLSDDPIFTCKNDLP